MPLSGRCHWPQATVLQKRSRAPDTTCSLALSATRFGGRNRARRLREGLIESRFKQASPHAPWAARLSAVQVLHSHNIVFARVAADLHLDDFERDQPRIDQAVYRTDRDLGRLVLV